MGAAPGTDGDQATTPTGDRTNDPRPTGNRANRANDPTGDDHSHGRPNERSHGGPSDHSHGRPNERSHGGPSDHSHGTEPTWDRANDPTEDRTNDRGCSSAFRTPMNRELSLACLACLGPLAVRSEPPLARFSHGRPSDRSHGRPNERSHGRDRANDPTGTERPLPRDRTNDPTGDRTNDPTGDRTNDPTGDRTNDPTGTERTIPRGTEGDAGVREEVSGEPHGGPNERSPTPTSFGTRDERETRNGRPKKARAPTFPRKRGARLSRPFDRLEAVSTRAASTRNRARLETDLPHSRAISSFCRRSQPQSPPEQPIPPELPNHQPPNRQSPNRSLSHQRPEADPRGA